MKFIRNFSIIAICTIFFVFSACGDDGSDDSKTVDTKYRFTGGVWEPYGAGPNGTLTLDENTITTSTAGFSYNNVYTSGGGSFPVGLWGSETTWAYLYSGSIKIGFVVAYTDDSYIHVKLGKTYIEDSGGISNGIDTNGMQDDNKGFAE